MKPAYKIDHHQRQKRQVRRAAGAADRAHEAGIDAFDDQRPVDRCQHHEADGRVRSDEQQGRIVQRQHIAEQHVQEIDVGALERDDGDAERERKQVESRQRRILLEFGRAGDKPGKQGNNEPGDQAARGHGEQVEPGEQKPDGRPGQNGVRHGIAHEAHATEHQEHADGTRAQRQRERARKRAAHELELGERRDEEVVRHHTAASAHSRGVLVECFAHAARREKVSGVRPRRAAPSHRLARKQQRLRKMRAHEIDVVHARSARCASRHASASPARTDRPRSWRRPH